MLFIFEIDLKILVFIKNNLKSVFPMTPYRSSS